MKENKNLLDYNFQYPSIQDLKKKARQRIPKFAFDYLVGGCNDDVNLLRNETDLQNVILTPSYLKKYNGPDLSINLFGHVYDAPFGIAPIGLQGLIWPDSPEILAKAALRHNIPFILSTVSTTNIERIAELTDGNAWFQLYHPTETHLRDDLLRRAANSGYSVLVLLVDVPSFGYRPRDIKNGLAMPPKMSARNILQAIANPRWSFETMKTGIPGFATLKPYMPKNLNLKKLGHFMNETFTGRVDVDKIASIRDKWKGMLVLKGIASEEDAQKAIAIGADGMIVSNHGGRQLDAGESAIKSLKSLSYRYANYIKVMIDGGLRSGPDVARALALGADFTFMGRPFMYGVGALGKKGGNHSISIFKIQLQQIMEQLGCEKPKDFPQYLAY